MSAVGATMQQLDSLARFVKLAGQLQALDTRTIGIAPCDATSTMKLQAITSALTLKLEGMQLAAACVSSITQVCSVDALPATHVLAFLQTVKDKLALLPTNDLASDWFLLSSRELDMIASLFGFEDGNHHCDMLMETGLCCKISNDMVASAAHHLSDTLELASPTRRRMSCRLPL